MLHGSQPLEFANDWPFLSTTHIYPRASCEPADPANTVTTRLNNLLTSGGQGYTLSLCPNQNYLITAPIQFTAAGQEISTLGLPTDNSRAMLTVSGPATDSGNTPAHTTAVQGCDACNGAKLRHIQVNIHFPFSRTRAHSSLEDQRHPFGRTAGSWWRQHRDGWRHDRSTNRIRPLV